MTRRSTSCVAPSREYDLYRGYYRDRGKNPRDAVPQDVFVAGLKQQRQAEAAQ